MPFAISPQDDEKLAHGALILSVVVQIVCALVWAAFLVPSTIAFTALPPYSDTEEGYLFAMLKASDSENATSTHDGPKVHKHSQVAPADEGH